MNSERWAGIPAPQVLVAGIAFHSAVFAATDLAPDHLPEPELVVHDDGAGGVLVLDLSDARPLLVLFDWIEYESAVLVADLRTELGVTAVPGPFAQRDATLPYTGAARWDGDRWAPRLGLPALVTTGIADDADLLGAVDHALGEHTTGFGDRDALADLLAAVRAGTWDEHLVRDALHCTPDEDSELLARPDVAAACAVLDRFRPALRRAGEFG